jgi:hypothetical protein
MVCMRKVEEQLFHFLQDFFFTFVLAVNLVDYQDYWKVQLKCLGQHVTRLWQGAFCCVYEQQNSVNQGKCSLNFAAEVSVTWGVNQVDLGALPLDLSGFSQNGDSTFAFLIVIIHDSVYDSRVGGKSSRAAQQRIYKSGFAMVYVRHKGDIAQII